MMKMKIDYEAAVRGKRPVRTERGHPVRLVSNKGSAGFPLVGYYTVPVCGEQGPYEWTETGEPLTHTAPISLIQEPEAIESVRYHRVSAAGLLGPPFNFRPALVRPAIGIVKLTTRIVDGNVTVTGESV